MPATDMTFSTDGQETLTFHRPRQDPVDLTVEDARRLAEALPKWLSEIGHPSAVPIDGRDPRPAIVLALKHAAARFDAATQEEADRLLDRLALSGYAIVPFDRLSASVPAVGPGEEAGGRPMPAEGKGAPGFGLCAGGH